MPVAKFVTDIKEGRKDFDTIKGNVIGILSNINSICDGCSIPRPKTKEGPVDMEKCILDFEIIADIANNIVKNKGNVLAALPQISNLVTQMPSILTDCGIKLF